MKFRYARHTNDLKALKAFYIEVIGLLELSSFENHNQYNGVFLGLEGCDWYLEFTESDSPALHKPDKDDLFVFYISNKIKLDEILKRASEKGYSPVISKNPYWKNNGTELTDPDGFGVILTVRV